jgi:hypothetical protein
MKTKLLINLIGILGLALFLLGCANTSVDPIPKTEPIQENIVVQIVESVDVDPPVISPTNSGKASVTGSIYSLDYNQPIVGIPVSLSEIIRDEFGDGVYVYDPANSPTIDSIVGGYFVLNNVDPGEYVLVVGNVEINTYKIISTADGLPQIFDAASDQITDLGNIEVEGMDVYAVGASSQDGYPAPEAYPDPESDS